MIMPRWLRIVLAASLVFVAPLAFAQDEGAGDEEGAAAEEEGLFGGGAEEADLENIDEILAQDEEVLSGYQYYTYDPGTRRDPFRSLVERVATKEGFVAEERPEGIPGLLIDEVEIEGIFITESGPVAQIKATSDETSYLLRPGDELWDGDVISITLEDVTFKQTVNDPTALKPFREVVKRLNP